MYKLPFNLKLKNRILVIENMVPGWVLLRLEESVKVPEAALHEVVGRHLRETHLKEDLPVLRPNLLER